MICKCQWCGVEFFPDDDDKDKIHRCPGCGSAHVKCGSEVKEVVRKPNPFYPKDWRK